MIITNTEAKLDIITLTDSQGRRYVRHQLHITDGKWSAIINLNKDEIKRFEHFSEEVAARFFRENAPKEDGVITVKIDQGTMAAIHSVYDQGNS